MPHLWVDDQDEALAFYTQSSVWRCASTRRCRRWVTSAGSRWAPPASRMSRLVLMAIPRPPIMDPETAEQGARPDGEGFAGRCSSRPTTAGASYEELKGRGVEFSEAPEERPYGIGLGLPRPIGQQHPFDAGSGAGRGLIRQEFAGGPEPCSCILEPRSPRRTFRRSACV